MFGPYCTTNSWKCLVNCDFCVVIITGVSWLFAWGLFSKAGDMCWAYLIFLFKHIGKVPSVTCSQWNQLISGGSRVKNHLTVAAPLVFNHFDCQHDKHVVPLKAILCLSLCCKTNWNHWESFNWIERLWTGHMRTKSVPFCLHSISPTWEV